MRKLITPENNNGQDWAVGKFFACHDVVKDCIVVFFCDCYDTGLGYWMSEYLNPTNRRNVAERTINQEYWEAIEEGEYFWCQNWGRKVHKDGTNMPLYGKAGWTPREPVC